MDINKLLPVIVPAMLIQLGVQAYYIRHCWRNPAVSTKLKAAYIALIAAFNLPAAAAYMLLHGRSKQPQKSPVLSGMHMDSGLRQGVFILLVIAHEVFSLNLMFNGRYENTGLIASLLGIIFVLTVLGGLFVKPAHKLLYYSIPALKIVLAVVVDHLSFSGSSRFIVLIAVAGAINDLSLNESKLYSLCAFLLYTGSCTAKMLGMGVIDQNTIIGELYANLLIFILVFISFYTMKKQLLLNRLLGDALGELKEKSLQLEEMGAIAERNRIASEIHDNVGHKLTAAMITVEAGEKLLGHDNAQARQKLKLAREQIKGGIDSIRLSVKAIKQGTQKPFPQRLTELQSRIQKDTGLMVTSILEIKTELLPLQQSVLLQAAVECATNSVKHGKAGRMDILVQEHNGAVTMAISDDGLGSAKPAFGFGLLSMRERAQSIGGTLEVQGGAGEGFTVIITIPAGIGGEA